MNKELSHITRHASLLILALLSTLNLQFSTHAQGTAFTYQGRLNDGTNPANGHYDFQFILFNVSQFGFPVGPILTNANMPVNNGLFTTTLDFGPGIFSGTNYWLDISVRTNGGGAFSQLLPRQPLTPAPYSIMANSASNLLGTLGSAQLSGVYSGPVTFNNAGDSFTGNGSGLTSLNANNLASGTVPDARLAANVARTNQVWRIGGNAGTSDDFIGTVDDTTFNIRVNKVHVMRYELGTDAEGSYTNAPNVVGGSSINTTPPTVVGATIAGGGGNVDGGSPLPNKVTADFGTVGGGANDTASGDFSTVAGGYLNTASGDVATVAGGYGNIASGIDTTVAGGFGNSASVESATVAGGFGNTASGYYSTVAGGYLNAASGYYSTVAGGSSNSASGNLTFAAGTRAKANHAGSFVWADSTSADFATTATNQFLIRASGGVGIGTTNPLSQLEVAAGFNGDGIHLVGSTNGPKSPAFRLMDGGASRGVLGLAESAGDFNPSAQISDVVLRADAGRLLMANAGGSAAVIIDNNQVGIGRVAAANALEVAGNASKTTAGSWIANSDARIKTDIEPVAGALERLGKVRLVSFRYSDGYRAQHPEIENRRYLNIIAQEFREVFPDDVKSSEEKLPGEGEAILQADTYPLTIYSAAAIQELNQTLTADLKEKQTELAELRQRAIKKETEVAELQQGLAQQKAETTQLKEHLEKLERLLEQKTTTH